MTTAPLSKLAPPVVGGFVAAYGLWSVLTKDSDKKLPHTIRNPEWKQETAKYLANMPRQGSDTPVLMNPLRRLTS